MSRFNQVQEYAKGNGHSRACAPIAMSLVTGESFDVCHKVLEVMGYRPNKPRGTKSGGYMKGLHELGFNTRRHGIPSHIKTNITLKGKLNPNKEYIIEYQGHVAAYSNGVIEDWTDGRRFRVLGIMEIIESDEHTGEYLGFNCDMVHKEYGL